MVKIALNLIVAYFYPNIEKEITGIIYAWPD